MLKRGYEDVRMVHGGSQSGGEAMEKFFDYYTETYYGGKIISPITGKVIDIKSQK